MSYSAEVLADSPSFYWRLNEASGTNANDASANNLDGSLSGSGITYSQAGAIADSDSALLFDGSAGALQTASAIDFSGPGVVTVEFWLKVSAWNNTDDLACEFSANWNSNAGSFLIDPCAASTNFDVAIKTSSGSNQISFVRPSTGVFHHYVFVFKENTAANAITAYIDGVPWSGTRTETGTSSPNLGNYVMYFMCRGASSLFLNGVLDEVAVYPAELSSARVAAHYFAGIGGYAAEVMADDPIIYWKLDEVSGNFADSSGNGRTAILATGSGFTYQQPSLISEGFSVVADGDDRAASGGYWLASPTSFTIEAWIKQTHTGQANGYGIVEMGTYAPSFRVSSNDGKLQLLESHIALEGESTIAVNDGLPHHVVAKANGTGTSKIFIDGVDRTGTMAGVTFQTGTGSTGFAGQWPSTPTSPAVNADFIGSLDDIAIYDGALSDARIIAHYQAGIGVQQQAQVMTTLRHVSGHGVW